MFGGSCSFDFDDNEFLWIFDFVGQMACIFAEEQVDPMIIIVFFCVSVCV